MSAPVEVVAESTDRLAQLHALYAQAKADADEAATKLKAITDGIKLELTQQNPEATGFFLRGESGPPLNLTYSERWRLDSKRLKSENPELYVQYAVKGGAWTLKAIATGGDES